MFTQEELAFGKGHKGKLRVPHVRMVCEKLRAEHSNRSGAGEEGEGMAGAEPRGRGGAEFTARNRPAWGILTGRDSIWGIGC